MKRILSVLAVTALMVSMLVASVSPVFAKPEIVNAVCTDPELPGFEFHFTGKESHLKHVEKKGGFDCEIVTEPT